MQIHVKLMVHAKWKFDFFKKCKVNSFTKELYSKLI